MGGLFGGFGEGEVTFVYSALNDAYFFSLLATKPPPDKTLPVSQQHNLFLQWC